MSDTATQLNTKSEIANWCRRLGGMYAKDLNAIDEEKFTESPGGAARSIADFTSEVCGFNMMVTGGLKGNPMEFPDEEKRDKYKAQFSDKAFAMASVVSTSDALAEAFENCSDDDLAAEATAPWGETMTKFSLANIAISHVMYHDAQLNFIQSLHGDGEMHWFDEA